MIYLSFVVPCYNSQDYMERCINTLMPDSKDVEIIIVNDGSTDKTAEIAEKYCRQYPETVRLINQKNGGHGSAVNTGLANAKGLYFKVVDSDDWLDTEGLKKILEKIKDWHQHHTTVDLVVCNYIYDHLFENRSRTMSFGNVFKENEILSWNDIGRFTPSQYIIMHAAMFRTEVIRKSGVVLPEHTFYVDNIFVHQPLCFSQNVCYFNIDLYHYFIGREDQSVNETVMMKRIDQQIRVNKIILDRVVSPEERNAPKKLRKYLVRFLSIMTSISDVHLLMINDAEAMAKRKDLWQTIKQKDKKLYRKLRYRTTAGLTYLPLGAIGNWISYHGYKIVKSVYQFN